MSTPTEVVYETKTVKTIRGMEARTRSKLELEGWEFVSQAQGTVRSVLTFRRPKPKPPWKLFAIIGGVLVVLFIFIAIMASISGGGSGAEPADSESFEAAPTRTPPSTIAETAAPVESQAPVEEPASPAVETTVDELLDRLNSAGMGGIQTGDRFHLTGELFMSDLWMTGATGDYFVMLKAHDGQQDLTVFVDEAETMGWSDGTRVDMVVESVEATINGETSTGWLRSVSASTIP